MVRADSYPMALSAAEVYSIGAGLSVLDTSAGNGDTGNDSVAA